MSCPTENPGSSQLSYTWASFSANGFDDYAVQLPRIARMGFRVLTLVPTYRLTTRTINVTYQVSGLTKNYREILAIDASQSPSAATLKSVVERGIELGMHIRIVPHLDADVVFSSTAGEVYWRAQFVFDPRAAFANSASYFDVVLQPLMNLIVQVKNHPVTNYPNCQPCFSLTLGAELEMSVIAFPASWSQTLATLQGQRTTAQLGSRLDFGHKLNFDHAARMQTWITEINKINAVANPGAAQLTAQGQVPLEGRYLAALDYLSFSFYPNMSQALTPAAQWEANPTAQITNGIANEFLRIFNALIAGPFGALNVPLEIGEASIGTTNVAEPWRDANDPAASTPAGKNKRLNYVKGLLRFVQQNAQLFNRRRQRCLKFNPFSFWTTGRFDLFQLANPAAQDSRLNDAVREYNAANGCPNHIRIGGDVGDLFSGLHASHQLSGAFVRSMAASIARREARAVFAAFNCPTQTCNNKGLRHLEIIEYSVVNERSRLIQFLNGLFFWIDLPTHYTSLRYSWIAEILCTNQNVPAEDQSLAGD